MAERRLRDVEAGGGAAEVELVADGDEVLHQAQIERDEVARIDRRNLLIVRQCVLDGEATPARRCRYDQLGGAKMIKLLIAGIAFLATPPFAASTQDVRSHTLPSATAFPESIGAD